MQRCDSDVAEHIAFRAFIRISRSENNQQGGHWQDRHGSKMAYVEAGCAEGRHMVWSQDGTDGVLGSVSGKLVASNEINANTLNIFYDTQLRQLACRNPDRYLDALRRCHVVPVSFVARSMKNATRGYGTAAIMAYKPVGTMGAQARRSSIVTGWC